MHPDTAGPKSCGSTEEGFTLQVDMGGDREQFLRGALSWVLKGLSNR